MSKTTKISPEVIDLSVRMVYESQLQHESQWAAIVSIADKIGCTAQALRRWVRQHETNTRQRLGLSKQEQQRTKGHAERPVDVLAAHAAKGKAGAPSRTCPPRPGRRG
jgi:transposase-like protein